MDTTFLSNSYHYTTDMNINGINNNELIIGTTGSGKSKSIAEARLTHANDSSYIVTMTKRELMDIHMLSMEEKGYTIMDINLIDVLNSNFGFNPLEYLRNDRDYIWFASTIVNSIETDYLGNDKYWTDAAVSLLAAEIAYIKGQERKQKRIATLKDLINFHNKIYVKDRGSNAITNVDNLFETMALENPNSIAVRGWKQITCNAPKTANCIFSTLNNCLDKIFTDDILNLSTKENLLDIKEFVKNETILFLLTSPIDLSLKGYVNIIYGLLFKELFHLAEYFEDYKLPIPVHFICDDFATGCKIPDFEQYISIFRSVGISITLLLQSETQLITMYGEHAAHTIINNCDTIVYTGGLDIKSCQNISILADCPMSDVLHLKKDHVIIIRRGQEAVCDLRYQIYEDEEYKNILQKYEEVWGISIIE